LLECDLIKHLYSVKLTNIGWKKIGLHITDLLDSISDISDKMVELLVKKDAVKALVSILHFIDDEDPELSEEIREKETLTEEEKENTVDMGKNLLDVLIEPQTIRNIKKSIDDFTASLGPKLSPTTINAIRIELATLNCANLIDRFATLSQKVDLGTSVDELSKKIIAKDDFDGKLKMIVDFMKIFNGWIGSTDTSDNDNLFIEKNTGKKYVEMYSGIMTKNHPEEVILEVMTQFEKGVTKKVNILKGLSPEQLKEFKQDLVLGMSNKDNKASVEKASSNTTRNMNIFKDVNTV
jgi:hypothetical protein